MTRNRNITRENETLKSENKKIKSDIFILSDKIDALQKAQNKLIKQITYLMKVTDEATRKDMIREMGIDDETVDLDTYSKSLQQELSEVMDINKDIRSSICFSDKTTGDTDKILDDSKQLDVNDIIEGIDF